MMTVLISPCDWLGSVDAGMPPIYMGTEAQRNTPLLQSHTSKKTPSSDWNPDLLRSKN